MNIKLRNSSFLIKIFQFLFLTGVLLLQFYIYDSGKLQPSHILFLISFFIIVTIKGFSNFVISNKNFKRLLRFIFITIIINGFYSITHSNLDFLISSSHYIFGIITTYLTIFILFKFGKKNIFLTILFSTLFFLFILWFLGLGEYKFLPRYNGFFNDPNQMAHWALCTLVMIVLLNDKYQYLNYISLLLTSIIIFLSLSRSGLMGLFVVFFIVFIPSKKNILLITTIIFIFFIIYSSFSFSDNQILESFDNIITRLSESDFNDQADARGYNRVFQYPEYLVLGSGQAEDYRFKSDFEIHSTWMAILFYYGIFTFSYFLFILHKIFVNLTFTQIGVIMGPLFYGFSTFGLRTPVFWMFLGVIIFKSIENNLVKKKKLLIQQLHTQ